MGSIVGDVGHLVGLGGNGPSFQAQSANLIQPVSTQTAGTAQSQALGSVNQAGALSNLLNTQAQNGVGTQNNLTSALQAEALGQGPNPAQAALAQSTGQNIAAQGALAAGQRGGSQNVGLLARQIGQQGAGIQQNAIGQAATLQAQQQLAAQNQLQNLATSQVGQGLSGTNLSTQAALGNQGQYLGALQGYNQAMVGNTSSQNSTNAQIAAANQKTAASGLGGLANSAGGAATMLLANKGGEINSAKELLNKAITKKNFPEHLQAIAKIYHPKVMNMYCGGMAEGAVVPGNPKVPGKNTEKNDVVPAMLTPKEIVLPLSVTQSSNPGEAAKQFVEKIKGTSDFKDALRQHIKKRKSK